MSWLLLFGLFFLFFLLIAQKSIEKSKIFNFLFRFGRTCSFLPEIHETSNILRFIYGHWSFLSRFLINFKELIKYLNIAKRSNKPCVIHVLTEKGKGYKYSEKDTLGFLPKALIEAYWKAWTIILAATRSCCSTYLNASLIALKNLKWKLKKALPHHKPTIVKTKETIEIKINCARELLFIK